MLVLGISWMLCLDVSLHIQWHMMVFGVSLVYTDMRVQPVRKYQEEVVLQYKVTW